MKYLPLPEPAMLNRYTRRKGLPSESSTGLFPGYKGMSAPPINLLSVSWCAHPTEAELSLGLISSDGRQRGVDDLSRTLVDTESIRKNRKVYILKHFHSVKPVARWTVSDSETDEEPAVVTVFRPPTPSRVDHGRKEDAPETDFKGQLPGMR